MTTVDIEAIRARSAHVTEALDRLVAAPNPGHAGQAHAAAVASATDVPLLLNELERLRTRLGTVRAHRDELARAHDQAVADLSVLKSTEDAEATLLRTERDLYATAIARVVAGLNPDDYTTAAEMFAAVKDAFPVPGGQHG